MALKGRDLVHQGVLARVQIVVHLVVPILREVTHRGGHRVRAGSLIRVASLASHVCFPIQLSDRASVGLAEELIRKLSARPRVEGSIRSLQVMMGVRQRARIASLRVRVRIRARGPRARAVQHRRGVHKILLQSRCDQGGGTDPPKSQAGFPSATCGVDVGLIEEGSEGRGQGLD